MEVLLPELFVQLHVLLTFQNDVWVRNGKALLKNIYIIIFVQGQKRKRRME